MIKELVIKNRSYRRFFENEVIERNTLEELVDLARLSASSANRQPLKYMIFCEPEKNKVVFNHLAWAAYLKDWSGPEEGERPSAYIIVLGDKEISNSFGIDPGLAIQNILIGAVERGLGGCIFASIQRDNLRKALNISDRYDILYVVALGKPKEKVVIESVGQDGDIKYWRDEEGIHHVPKRSLEEILLN